MTKYRYSDEDFIQAIKDSISIREVLKRLGVAPHGGSYKTFQVRVSGLGIDTSHFLGSGHLKGRHNPHVKKMDLAEILVSNSPRVLSSPLKKRVILAGLLKNECAKCGIKDIWQGEPIVLHVDHINGDHFDHRIENLRLLCPNCHSQTPTYCAKNKKHNPQKVRKSEFIPQPPHTCETCGIILKAKVYKNCRDCYNSNRKLLQSPYERKTKIIWPSVEEIKSRLEKTPYSVLAKELGISDNAIRKHLKLHQ